MGGPRQSPGDRSPRPGAPPRPVPAGREGTRARLRDERRFSIAELEAETGINARTIRYYVAEGLLPPAHGRGPSATYDEGHLLRLKMILLLKAERLPLDEIKERLADLSDRDLARLLNIRTRPRGERWRRIALHPSLELHVREVGEDEDVPFEEAVERIVSMARWELDRLEERT